MSAKWKIQNYWKRQFIMSMKCIKNQWENYNNFYVHEVRPVYLMDCTRFQVYKVLLKKFFKFQDNAILLENSKRFFVHQVGTLKFLNKTTYQSPRVWEMQCYLYLCGWRGWRASVGRVLLWVAWVKCLRGWCERRASVGDVGGVPEWLRWLLC